MKAFILCGGLGTRLRPYTYETPKPMLPIAGKPILQYVVEHLKESGIKEMVMTVGYLNKKISDYFKDGGTFGVRIEYAVEDTPKNTAGSILDYAPKVKEAFVVIMGDAITNIDIKKMVETHKKSKATATVAVIKHKTKIQYGVVEIRERDNTISGFREKPELEHYINAGIYVFEPRIFQFIKEKEDFAKDVFPRLLQKGEKMAAFRADDGVWIDIGRIEEYDQLKDGKEIKRLLKSTTDQ